MVVVITHKMVADATTDEVRAEFSNLASTLAEMENREQRERCFQETLATLSPASQRVAELFSAKEQQHIDHVRETVRRIPEFPVDRKPHDFTKDKLYFFVTSSKFDCKVQGEGLEKLFGLEVKRHYTEESHHPEYEGINGKECDRYDIMEMAVDRMSRNIQFNGKVMMDTMRQYLPVFPLGDSEAKQQQFLEFVEKYTDLTEKVYFELFPDS